MNTEDFRRKLTTLFSADVAGYSRLMGEDEGRKQALEVLRLNPEFSLEYFAKTMPYKNQADTELVIEVLGKAGLK